MTAEDDVLEVLAARQALELIPQTWLDAARGAISPEEAARRVHGQEDPELVERSRQLFAPGEPAVDEQRLQELLVQGFAPPRSSLGVFAVVLALAAALVLALAIPWSGGPSGTALASYSLELEAGARLDRAAEPSAPTEVMRFYADRRFRATLRPWTSVAGAVEATVYACVAGVPRRLPVEPSVATSGLVEVETDVAALGLGVGTSELLFVVGRAGSLPALRSCEAEVLEIENAQVLRTHIEILAPPR